MWRLGVGGAWLGACGGRVFFALDRVGFVARIGVIWAAGRGEDRGAVDRAWD